MNFNYPKVCSDLLSCLEGRAKDVLLRRFGLRTGEQETLEAIGKSYGITRERVRQIENGGFSRVGLGKGKYQKVFKYFEGCLKTNGGLKREDILLNSLGGEKFQNHVHFLLTLGGSFERISENKDFYSLWTIDSQSLNLAKKIIDFLSVALKKIGRPISIKDFRAPIKLSPQALTSFIEISKEIEKGHEGLFGLKDWPEINPRGVKDKAYLVFKKEKKPLHFAKVSEFINKLNLKKNQIETNLQTVHNELIRDPRFVLVGRGIYALSEWGYSPGLVKDVILKILKESGSALTREEIVKRVLKQRLVKENTILLNLQDKKYFLRDSKGKYTIREA